MGINLKEATKKNKLKQFIKEREKTTPPADKKRFDKTLESMTSGKSSKARKSSKKNSS